jgi:uncharacterized membrane protein
LLALLVRLPDRLTLTFGLAVILFHDLFDRVKPAQLRRFDWLWVLLHRKGVIPHTHFFVLFPLIPLCGVMALGYVFGKIFDRPVESRPRIMLWLGLATTAAFVLLRAFNAYGNPTVGVAASSPGEWHVQGTLAMSIVSFLNVEKYPTSLQYLLMTLGLSLIFFSFVERFSQSDGFQRWSKPIVVLGRVPLLFYVLHLYAIHFAAILLAKLSHQPGEWLWRGGFWMNEIPAGYGHGLPLIYLTWFVLIVALSFPCAWFAEYRRRHKMWWLRYL